MMQCVAQMATMASSMTISTAAMGAMVLCGTADSGRCID